MTRITLYKVLLLPLFLFSVLFAQQPVVNDPEVAAYKSEAEQLVSFLQFLMNTVGSAESSARDKETIINSSYAKVFKNAQVQIEDDLIEGRSVITQKDVQAYLKDIDFFFQEVEFELNIDEISDEINELGEMYLLVSMTRHMKGITQEGEAINLVKPRFLEINIDESMRDMKIASMYTTKLSRDEELSEWWMGLPFDWKNLFSNQLGFGPDMGMADLRQRTDTVYLEDSVFADIRLISLLSKTTIRELENLLLIEELDLSDNPSITDLNALAKLSRLKSLNISGTQVYDLNALRNLTRLEILDCSNSTVRDISALQYAINLRELNASQTRIRKLEVLKKLPELRSLNLSRTPLEDIYALGDLVGLKELDLSETPINNISPLTSLRNLEKLDLKATPVNDLFTVQDLSSLKNLDISETPVVDIRPLSKLNSLEILQADQSKINSIMPLKDLRNLRKVYCDNTDVPEEEARSFMRMKPDVLIIFGSASLQDWWGAMSPAWKQVMGKLLPFEGDPGRDQLQLLVNVDRIDVRGNRDIRDLEPLQEMKNLRELDIRSTSVLDLRPLAAAQNLELLYADSSSISDLLPLENLEKLKELTFSSTSVADLSPLANLQNLELINADFTSIRSIIPLKALQGLKNLYCDGNEIQDKEARELLVRLPDCLIIYKSEKLLDWWERTPLAWKAFFRTIEYIEDQADPSTLHALTQKRSLNIESNNEIRDFYPLAQFIALEELSFSKTRISDLRHLSSLTNLKVLKCSQSPVVDLASLAYLQGLEELSIDNTPVAKLDPLARLSNLRQLSCSGTQVKDLQPLAGLAMLEDLDISNTPVRSLKSLQLLFDLKTLTCFNTKLSDAKVQRFKSSHPNTEVVYY